MSVAYFIVAEREVEGVDVVARGKALARSNCLTSIAQLARVTPLDEFFAMSPEEVTDLIEESGGDVPADAFPDDAWFEASEGLETVRGLLNHIANHSGMIPDEAGLLRDLREFEEALRQLAALGIRWHLGIEA